MYTPTKLTEYLEDFDVSWAKPLPENTPPDNIVVAYNKEPLFRLIQEKDVMTEEDLKPILNYIPIKILEGIYGKHLAYPHFVP